MLGPAWFNLGDRAVQPFAVAPWADDVGADYKRLPGILQRLRGEWVCVPFGIERPRRDLPADWQPTNKDNKSIEVHPHGLSSNAEWQVSAFTPDQIELALEYPTPHPVKELRRTIHASATRPSLEIRLQIEARVDCELPIGLHPTFRISTTPRRTTLDIGSKARGWTSPTPLEPDIARFQSDARDVPLTAIPLLDGVEDITKLPLPYAAEEAVLVTGHAGSAILTNLEERYAVKLAWDREVFCACQLWLSNQGRKYYPWNGRFLALGIEPIRAAFDLGTAVSRHHLNPLSQASVRCTQRLSNSVAFSTYYEIGVGAAAPGTSNG